MVFDLKTEAVWESDIRCPVPSEYRAVTMRSKMQDELAVFGFVRQSFKLPQMRSVQAVPIHIIQMMSKWYCDERVYLISWNLGAKEHWVVNMDDIIGARMADDKSKESVIIK